MKTLIVALLLLLAAAPVLAQETSPAPTPDKKLAEDFRTYKAETLKMLTRHFEKHPKCELRRVAPTIEGMAIFVGTPEHNNRAWAYPEKQTQDAHYPARMFVSSRHKWDLKKACETIIHEAFHLTVGDDGEFICGPDRLDRFRRVCVVQGVSVYKTADLDRAIEEHLEKYGAWK
jgi:hypothetical protein